MTRRVATLLVASLLSVVLLAVALLLHVPYVELRPGPVIDTLGTVQGGTPLIVVKGRQTYPTTGRLDLTTVSVDGGPNRSISLVEAVQAWLDRDVAVVPERFIYPPEKTVKQVQQEDAAQMAQSQDSATTAALRQLGIPVTTRVVVADVAADGPAKGSLQPGDVITSVNGTTVTQPGQVGDIVGKLAPGSRVTFAVTRDGTPTTVSVSTAPPTAAPTAAGGPMSRVGVRVESKADFPFTVTIGLKDVGGPSAGLMFALGIVDKLTPTDLTGGRHIAGTGEIADDGAVGPIGGVQQKIAAARQAGATVFLTPADNCADAAANRPDGLTLVEVKSLAGALDSLAKLRAGQPVPLCRAR